MNGTGRVRVDTIQKKKGWKGRNHLSRLLEHGHLTDGRLTKPRRARYNVLSVIV